ncbi:MAG: hypothetical protein ACFHX7_25380 [Pseudomonadota bacterium]
MTDLLDQIDASLAEVEEQLLDEFARIRDTADPDSENAIDAGIRTALTDVVEDLYNRLEHSGDVHNLQLLSERHEILYARIAVLRQLLKTKVPLVCLESAHEGIRARRRTLELRVIQQRSKSAPRQGTGTSQNTIEVGHAFHQGPTPQAQARNRLQVTPEEELAHAPTQVYLDVGVYSASRELAMVASLLRGGTLDRPPEARGDQPPRGKASFESRELSNTLTPRTPVKPIVREPPRDKGDIAQTPEEIRRKLEARQRAAGAGKASFAARDIEPEFQSEPPRRRTLPPAEPAPAPEPPRTGKAVFSSRDIEPVVPSDPPRRREPAKKAEAEEKPVKGPAVFEARDLTNNPFPKRD